MIRSKLTLQQRLDLELAEKAMASSFAFFFSSIVFYFLDYGPFLAVELKAIICATICILAVLRFFYARKLVRLEVFSEGLSKKLKWVVFLNAVCWGAMFVPMRSVIMAGSHEAFIMVLAVAGFCASSVITLSSSLFLAFSFQMALLVPATVLTWIDWFSGHGERVGALCYFFTIFIAYLIKQTLDSRKQMIEKIEHEMSLEKSYRDLKISNQRILEETAKSQHSARLAAVGEMAGGIAHEINTPLAVMLSNIEFLETLYRTNRQQFDETYEVRSGKVKSAIERVSKIIKGLRSFSQQSDRQPKEVLPVRTVVDETLEFCSEKMRQNSIELTCKGIPEVKINCHPVQISQVLLNLINNSFYEVTQPEVKERWIHIEGQLIENNRLMISVIDSGRGVPLEYQPKLFQPFFTSKGVGVGTGLGLSISKGIMRDHGGDLYFDPNSKETRFYLVIPLNS